MVGHDTIADFITRMRNAAAIGKTSVVVPYSKMKHDIARALEKEGYIAETHRRGRKVKKTLEVTLSAVDGKVRMKGARRISKPSRRVYVGAQEIRPVKNGFGALVLSTPKGIVTGAGARKENVGGEALFEIW